MQGYRFGGPLSSQSFASKWTCAQGARLHSAMISIVSIFINGQVSCVRCNYTRRVFELLARSEVEQGGCSRSAPTSVNRVVSKIEFAFHVRCFCFQVCKCRSLSAAASAPSAVTLFYTTAFTRPRLCGCSRPGCVSSMLCRWCGGPSRVHLPFAHVSPETLAFARSSPPSCFLLDHSPRGRARMIPQRKRSRVVHAMRCGCAHEQNRIAFQKVMHCPRFVVVVAAAATPHVLWWPWRCAISKASQLH